MLFARSDFTRTPLDHAILRWNYGAAGRPAIMPSVRSRAVRGMMVSQVSGGPARGWRDRSIISEDHEPFVSIVCNLEGREVCSFGDHRVEAHEGDVLFWRSDAELSFDILDESRHFVILVPRSRVEQRVDMQDLPFSWHQSARTPMGNLLSSLMRGLASNIANIEERGAECAIEAALDLFTRTIALERETPARNRTTLFDRVIQFIDRHLEETLSPGQIAAAHGISLRYLHHLFATRDLTVSSWIRERRLLRCQDALRMGDESSLTEIAQRWRFSDSAHFSRLFKQRFGQSPSKWRAQHTRSSRP